MRPEVNSKISGIIGPDTEFTGDIRFKDTFRIDGKFKGKILEGNTLIVGETGEIEADIDVANISINGIVKGKIVANERIEIFSKGKVTGTITSPKLVIEEGAFFQGTCQMELRVLEKKNKEEKKVEEKTFK